MGESTLHTDVTASSVVHDNATLPIVCVGSCPTHLREGGVTSSTGTEIPQVKRMKYDLFPDPQKNR